MKLNKKPKVVMKVSVADTLRAIEPGTSATFDCRELGAYTVALSAVKRLNDDGNGKNRGEYAIKTTDNGATYTVTRHKL